ncbi:MAG: hypothetical protein ACPGPE_06140 [Planctomycetota bacterium]
MDGTTASIRPRGRPLTVTGPAAVVGMKVRPPNGLAGRVPEPGASWDARTTASHRSPGLSGPPWGRSARSVSSGRDVGPEDADGEVRARFERDAEGRTRPVAPDGEPAGRAPGALDDQVAGAGGQYAPERLLKDPEGAVRFEVSPDVPARRVDQRGGPSGRDPGA